MSETPNWVPHPNVAPDGLDYATVLASVRLCAEGWEPEARLLGNIRAADIVRAINELEIESATVRAELDELRVHKAVPQDKQCESLPIVERLLDYAATFDEPIAKVFLEAANTIEHLCLPPDESLSAHPGCGHCMEKGTPIRPGQVCPKCLDRLPTKREYELQSMQKVYVVCTGEVYERQETYTLHDKPIPLCDYEVLYRKPETGTDSARSSLVCPRCGVDRLCAPCPTWTIECPMVGETK